MGKQNEPSAVEKICLYLATSCDGILPMLMHERKPNGDLVARMRASWEAGRVSNREYHRGSRRGRGAQPYCAQQWAQGYGPR